jgi:GT2 family glycosyltransferase
MGVPIVNGLHWLKRLIESIDYPVNELFIVNNNGKGEITEELDKIVETSHKHINAIKVTHLPYNLGCSGAWNLIIKCYMNSPYWLIVNNDVAFTPGLLEKMNDAALNTDAEMIHGKVSQWGSVTGGAYDLFLIKDSAVQKCGLFDENLYPIYAEDVDYSIRATNENIKTLNLNIEYLHGDKDYESSGSQTWRLDPENLKEKMNTSRILNETDYLYKKWGNDFYATGFYQTPFNNQNYDSKYTTYDLNFVRKKYLGF